MEWGEGELLLCGFGGGIHGRVGDGIGEEGHGCLELGSWGLVDGRSRLQIFGGDETTLGWRPSTATTTTKLSVGLDRGIKEKIRVLLFYSTRVNASDKIIFHLIKRLN